MLTIFSGLKRSIRGEFVVLSPKKKDQIESVSNFKYPFTSETASEFLQWTMPVLHMKL